MLVKLLISSRYIESQINRRLTDEMDFADRNTPSRMNLFRLGLSRITEISRSRAPFCARRRAGDEANRRFRRQYQASPSPFGEGFFIYQLASEYYLPIDLHIRASIPFSISCGSINRFPVEAEYYFQDAIHIDGSIHLPAMILDLQPTNNNQNDNDKIKKFPFNSNEVKDI